MQTIKAWIKRNSSLRNAYRKLKWLFIKLSFIPLSLQGVFKGKKRVFIDCGSNTGEGYSFFKKLFIPKWYDAILIEPNINCIEQLKKRFGKVPNIQILNKAVWVENGNVSLSGFKNNNSNTLETANISQSSEGVKVKAIDFAEFIKKVAQDYETIIVKMDIEGAEYQVLDHLIETNAIGHINHLMIEFHAHRKDEKEKQEFLLQEEELVKRIKEKGVGYSPWV